MNRTMIKKLTLVVGLTAALMASLPARAEGNGSTFNEARPYLYALGGIGAALSLPFIYNSLYYNFASQHTLNREARALLARVRSRYGQYEGIVRRNSPAELRSLASRFFEQRNKYDGIMRRVVCLAPQSDEYRYFNWRTAPYVYQLSKYAEAITDLALKQELDAAYVALYEINERVATMQS